MSKEQAAALFIRMQAEGYAQPTHEGYCEPSVKGSALANASAAAPLTRATATQKLGEFLQRVQIVNADERFLFKIEKVGVFGSYLKSVDHLGDIDLALEFAAKESDRKLHEQRCKEKIDAAFESGRTFGNFLEQLAWPEQEVRMFLRARSRAFSFHSFADAVITPDNHKIIYPPAAANLLVPAPKPSMKKRYAKTHRFKATVTQQLEIKNAKVVNHPTEDMPCIQIGAKYYHPVMAWLEYQPADKSWSSPDNELLLDNSMQLEDHEIEKLEN